VEWPRCNRTEYRPCSSEYEGFLDHICIFHLQGKHKTLDYNKIQGFTDEDLKSIKKFEQEKKAEEKSDFPKARMEINYIFGGPDSYESKRKQKLQNQEVISAAL
jgi:hypothetical protein